ncbi:prepilin-type N-terminal cleavage/methylation domain-containing protein [Lysinibacillus pakistanensis]|uniref:type II secretion system protein n=1 Tax=Lysinibacillus pakistanensis TaxID=759811 RepID=UPI003D2721C9
MFKKLLNKKLLKNQKGLTLIELLAVIVILAIVAAIAVPAIGNIIENSRYNAVKADAINALNAAHLYYTDNPGGETNGANGVGDTTSNITIAQLKKAKYLETGGKLEGVTGIFISPNNPKTIKGKVTYSGSKEVTFSDATITAISKDSNKGSGEGGYDIK